MSEMLAWPTVITLLIEWEELVQDTSGYPPLLTQNPFSVLSPNVSVPERKWKFLKYSLHQDKITLWMVLEQACGNEWEARAPPNQDW